MGLLRYVLVLLIAVACYVEGYGNHPYLEVWGGYRSDEITTLIRSEDPPGTFLLDDELRAEDIGIYEIGVAGRYYMCNGFFIRGDASYGWVLSGNYFDRVTQPPFPSSTVKAKIGDGYTQDYAVAIGYMTPSFLCCKVGACVGWSYDEQKIKMHHVRDDGDPDCILEGLRYKTRWSSPFVGFEGQFCYCAYSIIANYEYHWCPDWHADWLLRGRDIFQGAYSDKRHANKGYGDVFSLKLFYDFCSCWDIGVGFKYQYWKAKDGREKPIHGSFESLGFGDTVVDKVPRATWRSYEGMLLVRRYF